MSATSNETSPDKKIDHKSIVLELITIRYEWFKKSTGNSNLDFAEFAAKKILRAFDPFND
jgi:hypothetical protein